MSPGTVDCDHDCACACHLLLGVPQSHCNRGEEGGCCPNACPVCDGKEMYANLAAEGGA